MHIYIVSVLHSYDFEYKQAYANAYQTENPIKNLKDPFSDKRIFEMET